MGIKIFYDFQVDLDTIQQLHPDAVFIATGSVPAYPTFPVNNSSLCSPDEILAGKLPEGNRVLVIGGGMVGCEVADFLAVRHYRVDIVEQQSLLAATYNRSRRYYLMERLNKHNVGVILNTTVKALNLPEVKILASEKETSLYGYDAVIYAVGRESNNGLPNSLKSVSLPLDVYTIGDALLPRNAMAAIHEAAITAAEF